MASRIERLQNLVGQEDVYEEKASKPENQGYYSSESDDDEKILNVAYCTGGELPQPLGWTRENRAKSIITPSYTLKIGELAPPDEVFCSLQSVVKYPYNYIGGQRNINLISGQYFAKEKVYDQPWDFFYIYPPPEISSKAIILVPVKQLLNFLAIINATLSTQLTIPHGAEESGFTVSFPEKGITRPRYLGHSNDRDMSKNLREAVLPASYRLSQEDSIEPTDRSFEAFKKKIELLLENEKKKKKANKEKKDAERRQRQLELSNAVKRVQNYLGIRKSWTEMKAEAQASVDEKGLDWSEYAEALEKAVANMKLQPEAFSIEKAPLFAPKDDVIFISVDVEAYEHNHNNITEVGIATLDTRDIFKIAPGDNGKNWRDAIRARHFRIREYSHCVNHHFVQGCPDKFEFGQSEWVNLHNLPQTVASCFKEPYSGNYEPDPEPNPAEANAQWDYESPSKKRQLILVGHDTKQDIEYLKKIGYDTSNLRNLAEVVDTAKMYRSMMMEANPRSLAYVLADMGITGWHLHNAGNDAVYTLQALLAIAVRELIMREDEQTKKNMIKQRVSESISNAVENVLEQAASWESDGNGSDGGAVIEDNTKIPPAYSEKPAGKNVEGTDESQIKEPKDIHVNTGDSLVGLADVDAPETPIAQWSSIPHPPKKAASGKCKMLAKQVGRSEDKKVVDMLAERGEVDEKLLAAMESIVVGKATSEQKNFLEGEIHRCRELSQR